MFNTLRQYTTLLTTIAKAQPGIPRFNWNSDYTAFSIDGFSISLDTFHQGLTNKIKQVEKLIENLFRGCEYQDILDYIDSRLDPSIDCIKDWYADEPLNDTKLFSLFSILSNSWEPFKMRLLHHLTKDTQLFQFIEGSFQPCSGKRYFFILID